MEETILLYLHAYVIFGVSFCLVNPRGRDFVSCTIYTYVLCILEDIQPRIIDMELSRKRKREKKRTIINYFNFILDIQKCLNTLSSNYLYDLFLINFFLFIF